MPVKFDKYYKVLSNGQLLNVKKTPRALTPGITSAIRRPLLVMLGVGKYNIKEIRSASGVPIHLYHYPEWKNRVEPTY
jgi:aminopeptidase N